MKLTQQEDQFLDSLIRSMWQASNYGLEHTARAIWSQLILAEALIRKEHGLRTN